MKFPFPTRMPWIIPAIQRISRYSWLTAILLGTSGAHAIDLQLGDVHAPKPGITQLQLSYQSSEWGDLYVGGRKQPGNSRIFSSQYLLRLGHSFEIADHPAFAYLQTGLGYLHPSGSLSRVPGDSGLTDSALLLAFWPYANHATRTYLGVAGYLIAPTGSYDRQRNFNLGENRYRSALQVGYQAPLSDNLQYMAAFDTVWFGDNGDFGPQSAVLARHALYTGQAGLFYNITPTTVIGAAYFRTFGGETSINSLNRGDTTGLQRYQLTGSTTFPFGRLTLQYGGDLKTDNGYYENQRLIVRYTTVF